MPEAHDLRGLSCPEPTERARRAILARAPDELRLLVDDPSAREHLERMGPGLGYTVEAVRHARHDEVVLRRA